MTLILQDAFRKTWLNVVQTRLASFGASELEDRNQGKNYLEG